jgi:cephalosporin hydroxylase
MKIEIDTEARNMCVRDGEQSRTISLYSVPAFEILSDLWLKVEWSQKYSYMFTWLGRPIIQLPADLVRIQEVIFQVKPNLIIETGVAHGGSLIFYAGLFRAMGIAGRVIGIDIQIRPQNRTAIEKHDLSSMITLIEGDAVAAETVARVKELVRPSDKVLVVLDSCHTKTHVARELEAYHVLVSPGSYIVATDGVMRDLHDVPGGKQEWREDNPCVAVEEFARQHREFVLEQPLRLFNESRLSKDITHWPDAYLRRKG